MQSGRSEAATLEFQGLVGLHGGVEVADEEDDELRHVAQVGPVILVGVDEGQVDDVVHDVSQADGQDEQTLVLLFVAQRHVKAERHAIKNTDGDV